MCANRMEFWGFSLKCPLTRENEVSLPHGLLPLSGVKNGHLGKGDYFCTQIELSLERKIL